MGVPSLRFSKAKSTFHPTGTTTEKYEYIYIYVPLRMLSHNFIFVVPHGWLLMEVRGARVGTGQKAPMGENTCKKRKILARRPGHIVTHGLL